MAYVNSTRVARNGLIDRFAAVKDGMVTSLRKRRLYNATVTELNMLTDRELTDLGISRLSISDLAHEAAYGK